MTKTEFILRTCIMSQIIVSLVTTSACLSDFDSCHLDSGESCFWLLDANKCGSTCPTAYCNGDFAVCDAATDFVPCYHCDIVLIHCVYSNPDEQKLPQTLGTCQDRNERFALNLQQKNFPSIGKHSLANVNLSSLNLNLNQIKFIDEKAFDLIHGLKTLSVQENKISVIDFGSVRKEIELLFLSKNNLVFINESSFSSLDMLKILELDMNSIEFVHANAFSQNKNLKLLKMASNKIRSVQFAISSLVCFILELNIFSSLAEHSFQGFKSLKYLSLSTNEITTMKNRSMTALSNSLELINLRDNALNSIQSNTFGEDFVSLKVLILTQNFLKILLGESFKFFPSLQQLSFSGNEISVEDKSFVFMRSLRILDLTNSILTQLNGSEVFSGLENLEDLDMSYNSLTRLEEGTFSNLKKLKNLRLDFNLITSISKNLFKGLGSLTLLSLKENSLTALQNLTFWFLNSVNELDLNDNKLIKIEENVFVGINESLTHLGLSNNRLQFIKETHFNTLTRLLNLDLSNNQISSIEEKSFSALENLEKLALSRNSIFHFDQALFINQARLKTLDLSSNMIIKVTESMFKNLKSLEEFYLNDNSINVLSRMLFIDVWNLVILDLSNNFITDIDMLCFTNLSKLEKLYLNKVKQTLTIISSDKILFPSLRVLGLQGAPVKLSMQFELTDLESLDFNFAVLNNTIIQRIPVLTINSLSLKGVLFDRSLDILLGEFGYNLNEIDLSDNSLSSDFQKSILNSAYNLHKLALSNCGCVERLNLSIYTNLSFLDLSYNQIADYSDDLFNNNAHIKQLNLSHNNITTVKIKTFWPLFFLNVLDLSFNLISIIEANALENPSNLRKLDLSHNQIKQLNQIMFGLNEMTSLIQIDISFNRELTTVDLNIQTHLFDFINFGVCSLRDFPTQGFSSVPKIGSLILNKNKIVTVKRIYFTKVDAIKQLYLSENLISTIEDRVFNSSKQLLELDLSMNNISSLNNFTLVGLLSLQKLNLSSNRIQILQNGVFNDLVRIESLDLSSNMIRSIEKCTFFYTKHLRYLYIHQNPSLREFFIRGMIEKCERLKYIYMSPDVLFSMSIYLNVKDDLKAGYIKQVLDMKYFSPVNIVTNYGGVENKSGEINYTAEQCVYILFLLKNKVQFNMIDESDVNRYISDCAQTIMSAYLHISN